MVLRLRLYRLWLRITAYSIPLFSFWFAFHLRFLSSRLPYERQYDAFSYRYFLAFTFVAWAFFADRYRITSVEELLWERTAIRKAAISCVATSCVQCFALFFVLRIAISRLFFATNIICLFVLVLVMRLVFRLLVGYPHRMHKPIRILVLGADQFACRAASRLRSTSLTGCEIVGYVRMPAQVVNVKRGTVYELEEIDGFDRNAVDDIVIALPLAQFASISCVLQRLRRLGRPIRAVMDFGQGISIRERLFQFGNMQMMDLVASPVESLRYSVVKRVFDIGFSLFAIALTAPIMLIIAVAIRVSSHGPVIFKQQRVGLDGQLFEMYKFRSMRIAPTSESDSRWTTAQDPRCTVLGEFLRKTSLDELPQFFNVLKGDMSVVGPRPERPYFVRKFVAKMLNYNDRHQLKVGMTGWAQVNGWRGDTSIVKRVEYDLYYLQNWSLAFDMRIIAQTILSGLISKNAY